MECKKSKCNDPFLPVFAVIGLYEFGVIPSHKAGFFCQDPKLNFTLNGDTVSGAALVSSVLLLPIAIVSHYRNKSLLIF